MNPHRSDRRFHLGLAFLGGSYVLLIAALLIGDLLYTSPGDIRDALNDPNIRFAIRLSVLSATFTTILAMWVAVPLGYLLSRVAFRGKWLVELLLDVPLVLPPLVLGLSLLILFQLPVGRAVEGVVPVVYRVPAVILAQFAVSTAFAVRTMRITFDQIDSRAESVALTLGCTRAMAFRRVTLPAAKRGMIAAATLAWARAVGEFGPVQIFAGATPMKTVVLPTAIFFEAQLGRLSAAVAVSLILVSVALAALFAVRLTDGRSFVRRS
jgi:molybdate transport system permease protein